MMAVSINTSPSMSDDLILPSASGWREMPSTAFEIAMPIAIAPPTATTAIATAAAIAFAERTSFSLVSSVGATAMLQAVVAVSSAANAGSVKTDIIRVRMRHTVMILIAFFIFYTSVRLLPVFYFWVFFRLLLRRIRR